MNKIGFQNFRRFQDFPALDLGPVTFLVGRNNSGKSTLVKALLLIDDFLKSESINSFSFGRINVEDVNIVTYGRAKNKSTKNNNEDFISFDFRMDEFAVYVIVSGKEDDTTANVINFIIVDNSQNLSYFILPPYGQITYQKIIKSGENENISDENSTLLLLQEQLRDLRKKLKSIKEKSSSEYIEINHQINSVQTKIKEIKSIIKKESVKESDFSITHNYMDFSISEIFTDTIDDAVKRYKQGFYEIQKGKKPEPNFADYRAFYESKNAIERSVKSYLTQIKNRRFAYLGATLLKQSALFAIRDKSNALAQTIHEYKQLGIDKEHASDAFIFVNKWMSEKGFDIGESLNINMHAGEAYEVTIDGIQLADKGMGSIQAMLLILRLAIVIHKREKDNNDYTIIIEEPELNLHPKLQSRLADLFYEIFSEHEIKLIIETHSEYILRRSQVLVAEKELEIAPNENPFCVYYFPNELGKIPYKLGYQPNGRFNGNFGEGFFDEATKSTMTLLKLNI